MPDPLAPIALLRAFAENPADGVAAGWVAARIAAYLDGTDGTALDDVFGIAPRQGGESWRTIERRRRRDAAIRELARHVEVDSIAEQARRVLAAASRYQAARWRRDRTTKPGYGDPRNRALCDLMRATDGRLPSDSTVRRVIAGQKTPLC